MTKASPSIVWVGGCCCLIASTYPVVSVLQEYIQSACLGVNVDFNLRHTPSEHESTFADAVVVVHILGTEVCSVDDQAALSACRSTVTLQEQPDTVARETQREIKQKHNASAL